MFIIRRQRQFRRQPVWSASSAVCSGADASSGPHECLFLVNLELMVWMKLSRPCVRIKRPDLCCAPRSTCPRAEECRTAGLGKQRRRTTQRHHVQRLSILVECPEVRNSNRSTAARPISSDWYVPLGWVRLPFPASACLQEFSPRPHGIVLHAPAPPAAPSGVSPRPHAGPVLRFWGPGAKLKSGGP